MSRKKKLLKGLAMLGKGIAQASYNMYRYSMEDLGYTNRERRERVKKKAGERRDEWFI